MHAQVRTIGLQAGEQVRTKQKTKFGLISPGAAKDIMSAVIVRAAAEGSGEGIIRASGGNLVLSSGKSIDCGRINPEVVNDAISAAHYHKLGKWNDGLRCPKTVVREAEQYLAGRLKSAKDVLESPVFELWRMKIDPAKSGDTKAAGPKISALFLVEDNPFSLLSITPVDFHEKKEPLVCREKGILSDLPEMQNVSFNRAPITFDLGLSEQVTLGMKAHHAALSKSILAGDTEHELVCPRLTESEVLSIPNLVSGLNLSFHLTPELLEEIDDAGTTLETLNHLNVCLDQTVGEIKAYTKQQSHARHIEPDRPRPPSLGMMP